MRVAWTVLAAAGCAGIDLDADGVPASVDCNDADPAQRRPVTLYVDVDSDGFGGPTTAEGCPGNGWLLPTSLDCDDSDPEIHPGNTEVGCDGIDNDCDLATVDGPAFTVGATWASVQDAIDAAGYWEWVELCGSSIRTSLVVSRPVELRGAGAERTTIDATGLDAAAIEVHAALTLSGVTVRGGAGVDLVGDGARYGGGLAISDADIVVLDDVVVTGGASERGGGVAVLGETSLSGTNVQIEDNRAELGGGLYVRSAHTVTLGGSTVTRNLAAEGGGVWLDGGLDGDGLSVASNLAQRGAGLHLEPGAAVIGPGITVDDNVASGPGGGVHGAGSLLDMALSRNLGTHGGGVYATGALVLDRPELTDNVATVGLGGGIGVPRGVRVTVTGGSLIGNSAADRGGGVYAEGELGLVDVRFEGNSARVGGGVACDGCGLEAHAIEVRDDTASDSGGGVHVSCGTARLARVTLAGNTAPTGATLVANGGTVRLVNSALAAAPDTDSDLAIGANGCGPGRISAAGLEADTPVDIALGEGPAFTLTQPSFRCTVDASASACATP